MWSSISQMTRRTGCSCGFVMLCDRGAFCSWEEPNASITIENWGCRSRCPFSIQNSRDLPAVAAPAVGARNGMGKRPAPVRLRQRGGGIDVAKRVLITDDALFMRVTLKNILTNNGYEVAGEATNGRESVEMYRALKPDLVTMDITMPEMDGISAVREIKKLDANAKVIMCTAMGQKNMVMEAMSAGARDFIVKPFQPEKVLESLQKLID